MKHFHFRVVITNSCIWFIFFQDKVYFIKAFPNGIIILMCMECFSNTYFSLLLKVKGCVWIFGLHTHGNYFLKREKIGIRTFGNICSEILAGHFFERPRRKMLSAVPLNLEVQCCASGYFSKADAIFGNLSSTSIIFHSTCWCVQSRYRNFSSPSQ